MKKDIVLIANYWHFEFEKASSRYRTMADILCANSMDVEVITSNFRHQTKSYRDIEYIKSIQSAYKVTLLHEPRYKKNITLRRIYSHHVFASEVIKYLKARKRPDLIIVSVPSLSIGSAVTKFANKHGIKVVVDIQDLWPEAFRMAVNIPIISDILFAPMMAQANLIYSRADKIMAVSETYVERGCRCNSKDADGLALYIGTDSKLVERSLVGKDVSKPKNEFWIGYIGALGHSYDIKLVIDAIKKLQEKGINNIVFKVMGDGVLLEEFKKHATSLRVVCDFLGFLDYGDMMAMLKDCDIAVNPIVGNSVSSIINKVSDYAMAGVPVINTQRSPEYRKLLKDYYCGLNCDDGKPDEVADAIAWLYYNSEQRKNMANNAIKLGNEKFDRNKTYSAVVKLVNEM